MKTTHSPSKLPELCAFLRGVNLGGAPMKMTDVCSIFEKAGMKDVSSIQESGNILFSSMRSKDEAKALLEKAMSEHFNYDAFLFIKDKAEIESICTKAPFEAREDFHTYCFIGVDGIEKTLIAEFERSAKSQGGEAQVVAGNFYWKVLKGNTLGSEFGKVLGRKSLKSTLSSRNLNTFERVLKKM